jgi:hypothetical protein
MMFPPFMAQGVARVWPLYRTHKGLQVVGGMFIVFLSLMVGVNAAQATFHPVGRIQLKYLEADLQKKLEKYDQESYVNFNKGL